MKIHFRPNNTHLFRALVLLVAVALLPYAISRLMSPWRCLSIHSFGDTRREERSRPAKQFRIACYNVAHGRGVAASNWDGGDLAERSTRLDQIAKLLRQIDADIVVLNEVDFQSNWSHSKNQARYLAKKAGYTYWVEQRNLDFRFLTWTWRFGNAVLTKHPVTDARAIELPGYSNWETILAGKKRGVICDTSVDGRPVRVIGTHLSHRSESLRVRSAVMLSEIASESVQPTIVAGDMNSTPSGFPNSTTDANGDNAMDTFDRSKQFQRSPKNAPSGDSFFTFHSVEPRSVIDWILIPHDWSFTDYMVHSSTLSDHRLVYANVRPVPN